MRHRRILLGLVGIMVWSTVSCGGAGAAGTSAEASDPLLGKLAPHFELATIDGSRRVASDTLFTFSSLTMLMFWTTHCAECVRRLEASEQLYEWGEPDGFNVVGVNFDEQPSSTIEILARRATPKITHLYDAGGLVTSRYGAGAHSFAVYFVDGSGIVRAARYDPPVDSLVAMRPQIKSLIDEAFADETPAANGGQVATAPTESWLADLMSDRQNKLSAHGRARIRWMDIDTSGVGATGAFNEPLQPGSFLHYRLEMELGYSITDKLRAGGLLLLSNEGEAVLRSGPAYLSNQWGTAFVRYDTRGQLPALGEVGAGLRAGYYDAFWTPLTLMRWDKDDTPISGGQRAAGCGCAGEAGMAGFILLESVETIAPEITFEGARVDLAMIDRLDVTALYARPQTASLTASDTLLCGSLDVENTHYLQQLYGGRATYHASVPWSARPCDVSGTAIATEDDAETFPCAISLMGNNKPFSDRLLGADLRVPLPARTEFYGEFVRSYWRPNNSLEEAEPWLTGNGLSTGLIFDIRPSANVPVFGSSLKGLMMRLNLGYQRLGEKFYSAYSALSYEPNLRGPRFSLRADWGRAGVGAFFRRLTPVVVPVLIEDGTAGDDWSKQTASVWVDGRVWPGATFMVGGVREDRNIPNDLLGKQKQDILVLSLVQELFARCSLILETQLLDGSRKDGAEEYTSTTVRSMLDVSF